ncbi:MAG TPA: twin-arginine translocase subunit TatB [Roseiarcus sp.]|jgi:sec-independent protein translocase protein TatB|nr:twin-arginine translocase subunit TatB [Roseiarcus sp.]
MFDLDISKMIIVGIVALAVVPPKDLPRVMRTVGQTIGKMRRMASEFQGQFMEAMREVEREADLDSVKKEFQAINDQAKIDTSFDPVGMMREDMTKAVAAPVGAPETGASDPGKPEIGNSEIALTGSEPAAVPVPAESGAEPEAPAARRSAAE